MKKLAIILGLIGLFFVSNMSFAEDFDALEGLTAVQKQKLSQIQYSYKQSNDSLEMRIMEYNNKIAKVKADVEKTPEQVTLLIGAYERNLSTLKTQQQILKQQTEAQYKAVMTDEQYAQFKAQQINVQEAFKNFLQK